MPDREKTIEDLKQLAKDDWVLHFNDPDVNGIAKAINETAKTVLALLNEQKEEIDNLKQTCQSMMEGVCLLKSNEAVLAHWDDDTGHWIEGDRDGIDPHTRTTGEMIDTFRCSWCGFYQYWKTPFCPNCGAKMKVGEVNE